MNKEQKNSFELKYDTVFSMHSAVSDMMYYKDYKNSDGNYIGCNDAFAKFVNKPLDQIIGHNDFEIFGEKAGLIIQDNDKKVLDDNEAKTTEGWIARPDGTQALVNTSKSPLYDKNNHITGIMGITKDVTKVREFEKKLEKQQEDLANAHRLLKTIINNVPVRIFWKDKDLNYLGCNAAFARDLQKSTPEEIIGKNDYDLNTKEDAKSFQTDDKKVIDSGKSKLSFEESLSLNDGGKMWLRTSKVPLYDNDNNLLGILGVYDDITQIKNTESQLIKSQQYLETIIQNEPECVKVVDAQGKLIDMNPAGLEMLEAQSLKDAQKYSLSSYILPEWRAPFIELHERVMSGQKGVLEFEIEGLKGGRRWLETSAVPMRDAEGNITNLLGITRDITQRKKAEQNIHYLANYDSLTGLPNRLKLDNQLSYILSTSKRNNSTFALMFLDLDHFKDINDTLGHEIGDLLLIELGQRIRLVLREEDTVARLGGDEFILLFPDADANGAQLIAEKIISTVQENFIIKHHKLNVTASIGVAMYPDDGTNKETLFKNADTAMYRAKKDGRNNFSFYTQELQIIAKRNLELSHSLHDALTNKELYLVYQPQISVKTGLVIGTEALLRWNHPTLGHISPAEFIPIAENNGLILSIGEWVLRTATQQLNSWIKNGMSKIVMSVNLSAIQFRYPNLPELVSEILKSSDVEPECLELELTESVTLHNPQGAINTMNDLHERGIKMSIDDFGTGYSSLSHLKKFKVYKLKIDQSFVRDIGTDPEDRAIVSAIINMSNSLGLKTIAEGVETLEQLEYLKKQGCDEIQGYYYSKPLSADDFFSFYYNIKQSKL